MQPKVTLGQTPPPMIDLPSLLLWQDEAIFVLNKPSGLLTIPDGYDLQLPSLSVMLKAAYGAAWTVHRLDKDTSGVILFARSLAAHHALNDQFANRTTQKEYHALIVGSPPWQTLSIDLPLRVNGDRRHRTIIDPERGQPARTLVQVRQNFPSYTLVSAHPYTGYTHQIRAHLAAVGFPILADPLYQGLLPQNPPALGGPAALPVITRTALHAYQITFVHPLNQQSTTFEAPYPPDFRQALAEGSDTIG